MKNSNIRIIALQLMLLFVLSANAQEYKITKFKENLFDLTAASAAVKDRNGDECALIRFAVQDNNFEFEPNLGVVKMVRKSGEIQLFVPQHTKMITVRHAVFGVLRDYSIPVDIEAKTVYDAVIVIDPDALAAARKGRERHVYANVGFNVLSIMGPAIAVGVNFKHHNAELGFIYGLNKTDDIYIYDNNGNLREGYKYNAMRTYLRYGYQIPLTDFISVTPQVGAAYNYYNGKQSDNVTTSYDAYKSSSTFSGTVGARLQFDLNNALKVYLTPEYDFALGKDNNYKVLSSNSKFKSFTEGFNLAAGVIIYF